MTKPCVLECTLKANCPRKRRVADPDGYCRYQTLENKETKEGTPCSKWRGDCIAP